MADHIVKPETKRAQDVLFLLDEKKVMREKLVAEINRVKVEFENKMTELEKTLEKHDVSVSQLRMQLRAEITKLDPSILNLQKEEMDPRVAKRLVPLPAK